jgi:prepilin-type N-terminal cleavage/methylation domain-containing protein
MKERDEVRRAQADGRASRAPERRKTLNARGFTLIELLIVIAIVVVVAAIAVPSMLRARISANETTAVSSMRAINSAQASYSASAGGGAYAPSLATLGDACPSSSTAFITADLATDPSVKSGYRHELQPASGAPNGPDDCNGMTTRAGFYSTGVPLSRGYSGHKGFGSNSAGAIYFDVSGSAPTEAAMAPGGGGSVIQ